MNACVLRFFLHLHEKVGNLVKEVLSCWEGPQNEREAEGKEVSQAHDVSKDARKAMDDPVLDFYFHGEIEDERVVACVGMETLNHVLERLLVHVQVRELFRLGEKLDYVVSKANAMLEIVDSLQKRLLRVKFSEQVNHGD